MDQRINHITAAGFVIVRIFDDGVKFLALASNRGFDIPKGRIEHNEDPYSCAIRETFEESGVFRIELPIGREFIHISTMHIYLGITDQDPKILPNPITGVLEHDDAIWVSFDEMESSCISFLIPAIRWAKNRLNDCGIT